MKRDEKDAGEILLEKIDRLNDEFSPLKKKGKAPNMRSVNRLLGELGALIHRLDELDLTRRCEIAIEAVKKMESALIWASGRSSFETVQILESHMEAYGYIITRNGRVIKEELKTALLQAPETIEGKIRAGLWHDRLREFASMALMNYACANPEGSPERREIAETMVNAFTILFNEAGRLDEPELAAYFTYALLKTEGAESASQRIAALPEDQRVLVLRAMDSANVLVPAGREVEEVTTVMEEKGARRTIARIRVPPLQAAGSLRGIIREGKESAIPALGILYALTPPDHLMEVREQGGTPITHMRHEIPPERQLPGGNNIVIQAYETALQTNNVILMRKAGEIAAELHDPDLLAVLVEDLRSGPIVDMILAAEFEQSERIINALVGMATSEDGRGYVREDFLREYVFDVFGGRSVRNFEQARRLLKALEMFEARVIAIRAADIVTEAIASDLPFPDVVAEAVPNAIMEATTFHSRGWREFAYRFESRVQAKLAAMRGGRAAQTKC